MNSKDMSNDNDPLFLAEFYKNLKILSQDYYKKSSANSYAASKTITEPPLTSPRSDTKLKKFPRGSVRQLTTTDELDDGSLTGEIVTNNEYFSDESIAERLKVYAKRGGIPLEYFDRYSELSKASVARSPTSVSADNNTSSL